MSYYKNQELQITAKFVGVADDGKIQIKIKGIDNEGILRRNPINKFFATN